MTLRPVEPIRVTIPPQDRWTSFEIPPHCQTPSCTRAWDHRHHVIRRSDTGGPVDFVSIDGLVVVNKVGLCLRHHEDVTGGVGGHRARIRFPTWEEIEQGLYSAWWLWYARQPPQPGLLASWDLVGPLDKPVY